MALEENTLVTVPDGKGGRRRAKVFRDFSSDKECPVIWVHQWVDEAWYWLSHPFAPEEVEVVKTDNEDL